jgi:hypothetical protein
VSVNLNYTLSDDLMNYCIREAGIRQVLTSRAFIEKKPVKLDAELIFLEDLKAADYLEWTVWRQPCRQSWYLCGCSAVCWA